MKQALPHLLQFSNLWLPAAIHDLKKVFNEMHSLSKPESHQQLQVSLFPLS